MSSLPSKRPARSPAATLPLWLAEVDQSLSLDQVNSVLLIHGTVGSEQVVPPQSHPCCKFSILLSGSIQVSVVGEKVLQEPGDIFFIPPELPHNHTVHRYPVRYCAIFFSPVLLLNMAPELDGQILLHRFLAHQPLRRRILRLPPKLRKEMVSSLEELIRDSEDLSFGHQALMRGKLMEMLIRVQRWEIDTDQTLKGPVGVADWQVICQTLAYLREHCAETIYAKEVARFVGTNSSRLRALFHELTGTTWGHYLNQFRIQKAAHLLCYSRKSVTEIALECGFQTSSYFDTHFSAMMACRPLVYRKKFQAGKFPTGKTGKARRQG